MSTILKRTIIIFPRSSAVYTNIFTIIGEGKKRADTYLKVGIQHRMTPSDEQKTERRRRADGKKKERKRGRKKCIHGHPPTSTSSYVKKERPALFQPFPLTTSPANAGGGGGGAGERKVTVHFFPGFIFPAPNPSVCH